MSKLKMGFLNKYSAACETRGKAVVVERILEEEDEQVELFCRFNKLPQSQKLKMQL